MKCIATEANLRSEHPEVFKRPESSFTRDQGSTIPDNKRLKESSSADGVLQLNNAFLVKRLALSPFRDFKLGLLDKRNMRHGKSLWLR